MRLREDDINFLKIDGRLFEEMCFDLLRRLGFHAIVWRQGGADHGRDIEGRFTSANPLIGTSTESWFFECKNQATGVSVADLCDKLQWADAEKPDHFVILAGSHLTNDCRTWLAKISADKRYRLHVVEGKELNRLVRAYPELVERYFAGPYELLLRDLIRGILLDRGDRVHVHVLGEARCRVAEPVRDHLDVDAGREAERGVGVA